MILTCPECSTKYMTKDGSIGPNGRSVRCARCESVWYVEGADPDEMALEDNKAVLLTVEEPVISEPSRDIEPEEKQPFRNNLSGNDLIGAHTLLRDKADAEKRSQRRKVIRLIWGVPLFALFGMAALTITMRQTIVERFPQTATLYQTLGMNVKANGLDIQNLTDERVVVDGEIILRVTGEVVNLTSRAKESPLVQLRLENRSGEVLASWFLEPGTIAANSREKIETDYPSPPIDGVELRYRFNPDE